MYTIMQRVDGGEWKKTLACRLFRRPLPANFPSNPRSALMKTPYDHLLEAAGAFVRVFNEFPDDPVAYGEEYDRLWAVVQTCEAERDGFMGVTQTLNGQAAIASEIRGIRDDLAEIMAK